MQSRERGEHRDECRAETRPEEQRRETRAEQRRKGAEMQRRKGAKAQTCRGAKAQRLKPVEFRAKERKRKASRNAGEQRSYIGSAKARGARGDRSH